MTKIPKSTKLPTWISEFLPSDLVDSTLFRFEITLQAIDGYICRDCGHTYTKPVKQCVESVGDGHICNCSRFRYQYKKITVDLLPDLDLDYDILEDQMQSLPAQYAFWSAVYSEARLRVAVEERKLKATRGKAIEEVQRRAAGDNVRLTGEQVKSVVEADDATGEADLRLAQAHMLCGKLFHMLEALKMKSELARSLSGFKRQEQDRS